MVLVGKTVTTKQQDGEEALRFERDKPRLVDHVIDSFILYLFLDYFSEVGFDFAMGPKRKESLPKNEKLDLLYLASAKLGFLLGCRSSSITSLQCSRS